MNNPLAGTDPTGYMGCAASKIDSVCDTTLSHWGGNGKADAAFYAPKSDNANSGNGAKNQSQASVQGTPTTDIQSATNRSWNPSKTSEIAEKYENFSTDVDDEVAAMEGSSNDLGQTASRGQSRRAAGSSNNMNQPFVNARIDQLIKQIQAINPSFTYSTARPSHGPNSRYNQNDINTLESTLVRMRQESGGWTVSARIKDAGLPTAGPIRYVPPTNYKASMGLPRGPNKGIVDRFGNEWIRGPSRTRGQSFEWDVQLSPRGREQMGTWSRDGRHLNISLDGIVTH